MSRESVPFIRFRVPHGARVAIVRLTIVMAIVSNVSGFVGPTGFAADAKKAVILGTAPVDDTPEVGQLVRELVRQAFLIAARDEMGLATRDSTLREDDRASKAEAGPFEILVSLDDAQEILVQVFKVSKPRELLKEVRLMTAAVDNSVSSLASQAELMSRNEFVTVLTDAKCARRKLVPPDAGEVPDTVKQQMSRMSCLAQFGAIRQLRSEIMQSGESAVRLTAQCRSYAKLGTMTQFHWSPAHKVFKARALLYAERLNVKYPSDSALRTRAYVRALIGLHQNALDDLEAADKLSKDAKQEKREPDEADIIRAFCRYDSAKLTEYAKEGPYALLANYFILLAVEPTNIYELRMRATEGVLQHAPECIQAIDAMQVSAPLGIQNALSTSAPTVFTDSMYQDLAEFVSLPASVQKLVDQQGEDTHDKVSLMQALRSAGRVGTDRDEPSLAVAAGMIQDVAFIHLWRRLDLERYKWGWQSDDTLRATQILVKGHPYAAFIDSHHTDQDVVRAAVRTLATLAANDPHLNATEAPILHLLIRYPGFDGDALRTKLTQRSDDLYCDLIAVTGLSGPIPVAIDVSHKLNVVSPYLPATIATSINFEWQYASTRAAELERDYGSEPLVQEAFGRTYQGLKQWEQTERWLKRRVETLPDKASYARLADFYRSQNQEEKWAQTLLDSLEIENFGLEEAQTRVALAKYFMGKGEFEQAIEHADSAAESEASWALTCAAECHEQIGDFDSAEEFVQRNAVHYNDYASTSWYLWCRRTGRGDVEEARKLAEPSFKNNAADRQPNDLTWLALFHYAEGDKPEALDLLKEAFVRDNSVCERAVQAAFIAEEIGQTQKRDELLNAALRAARARSFYLGDLIHDFRNALREDNAIPFDKEINRWRLQFMGAGTRAIWSGLIGRFLVMRGKDEDATPFLQAAATSRGSGNMPDCIYAGILLKDHKIPCEHLERPGEPSVQFQDSLSTAYAFLKNGNLKVARESLDAATAKNPDSLGLLFVRAMLDNATGERTKAVDEVTKCLDELPQSTDMLLLRARWNSQLRNYKEAIRDLEKVIELDPDRGEAYFNFATILATSGIEEFRDGQRAVRLAQKSLETDSEVPPAVLKLGLACAFAESGDFPAAVKCAVEVIGTVPKDTQPTAAKMLQSFRENKPFHY